MQIEDFVLERRLSQHENSVEINLSDSGVHPCDLRSVLTSAQIDELCSLELGYGWTNGTGELRDTISALYPGRTRDNVLVTNGSTEAIFVMIMSLLSPGDELICVVPSYLHISGWARAAGVTVKTLAMREQDGWVPDLNHLRALITPRTRMISIANPNNPTGAVLSEEQMRALAALAAEHDLYLHADEIYKGSEIEGEEGPSFSGLHEKILVTSGLSKAMAMPGLRLGWMVGPAAAVQAGWRCKDYTTITTNKLSEFIACHALQPQVRRRVLDRGKHMLGENLALLTGWVHRHSDCFSFKPPRAGGMAFLRYALRIESAVLVERLRVEKGVLICAGDAFGLDGYVRIAIGVPRERLQEGLRRIRGFVLENPALREL
jgi:aspartate/methionine/tyrosine aminotransferase